MEIHQENMSMDSYISLFYEIFRRTAFSSREGEHSWAEHLAEQCVSYILKIDISRTAGHTPNEKRRKAVLRIRIRDPVPFWPLDPGSGMGKQSESGSGIRDEQPGSYFLELRNHFLGIKYLNSLMRMDTIRFGIRDGKKSVSGSGINIPDLLHWRIDYYFRIGIGVSELGLTTCCRQDL